MNPPASSTDGRPLGRRILLTGGAGFIGTNLADGLARAGDRVLIYDDFSRLGAEENARWLRREHPGRVEIESGSVVDSRRLGELVASADAVVHLAAQVAATSSVKQPLHDFRVNLEGTVNLLEAVRRHGGRHVIFPSTSKVYGELCSLPLEVGCKRYRPVLRSHRKGVSEEQPLDFHSPYGCSKGAADQYVLDYGRIYGFPTTVFRMSCIYGPHQHGTEDQGWVAHFLLRALAREPITVFGDGRQVRDLLFVADLVEAFARALASPGPVAGRAFNLGGGPDNTVSLLELLELIEVLDGRLPEIRFERWRPGDQRWYVTDTERFRSATGWKPRVVLVEGVARLYAWLRRRLEVEVLPAVAAVG